MIRSSAAPDDERALIERARTDPDAFAELYRRHVDGIHRFARRRTGDDAEAEDITSVTFERALAGLGRFRPGPDGIAPWLYRIAGNEIIDRQRRAGRRRGDRAQRAADRSGDRVAHDDTDAIERGDETRRLRAALASLNPRYQQALSLRYLADLDATQAAAAMDMPRKRFAVVLHRATTALRAVLADLDPGDDS
ncbi:MAG: sigma-70 family RNA polymerase sigma factor [Actinomycetota bacterium]